MSDNAMDIIITKAVKIFRHHIYSKANSETHYAIPYKIKNLGCSKGSEKVKECQISK